MAQLYSPLSPMYEYFQTPEIPNLDQAVLYGQVRAFKESLAIFESFSSDVKQHPVIAYELSTILYAQGRPKDSANVITETLLHEQQHLHARDFSNIYRFLRLSLAVMEVFSEGSFVRARESLKEIRAWLLFIPIEDYTPLQVLCIRRYYSLMLMVGIYASSCDFRRFSNIVLEATNQEESGLLTLFKHLQGRGRVCECLQLLKIIQCFHLDETTSEKLLSEYIQACSKHNAQDRVWYCEGQARLLLATQFAKGTDTQKTELEFICATRCFDRAPVSEILNNLELEVKVARIWSGKAPRERLARWTTLLEEKVADDFTTTAYALRSSFEAALEVHKENPREMSKVTMLQLQKKLDCLYEKVGDLHSLYLFHAWTADSASLRFDDIGDVLRWHENFEKAHPNFTLWDPQLDAKRTQLSIYSTLSDHVGQYKIWSEFRAIMLDRESFWCENNEGSQEMKERGPHVGVAGKFANVLGKDINVDEQEGPSWFSEWQSCFMVPRNDLHGWESSWYVQPSSGIADDLQPLFTTLLRWLQTASKVDELTEEQLRSILMLAQDKVSDKLATPTTALERLTPGALHTKILGSSASPTSATLWEKGFGVLTDWLSRNDRYFETKRHVLLANLLASRTSSRSFLTGLKLEDQIHEKQIYLDLLQRLNAESRKLLEFNAILWKKDLAILKINAVDAVDGPLCDDTSEEFREILALCESVREESQRIASLYLESSNTIVLVRLFTFSASKLRADAFCRFFQCFADAQELVERRRVGLKALIGCDKVEELLQSLLEIDWSGLVNVGLLVVSNISDSHQALRDQLMWNLVQFSKSLGLGWLTWTNTTSSFEQDGQKFSLQCLEAIANDSGSDVVFVDWIGPPSSCSQSQSPRMVVSHQGRPPQARLINLSWAKVERIIEEFQNFGTEKLIDGEALKLLRDLTPLVQYLSEITMPGQVLVLCPFGNLHSLPLHALEVDGQPLIRRNPVVYTSSMPVLNVAFQQRKAYEERIVASQRPWTAALFGAPPSPHGEEALQALSRKFAAPARIEDEFTTSNFCSAIQEADLLHFHGHGIHDEPEPLDNGLNFTGDPLTLRRIFDLCSTTTSNSFHVTLLACGSGMSRKYKSTSDIIGLVPAFLYAGASSTLSTLWSFSDADAALFSHAFYAMFDDPSASHRGGADAAPSSGTRRIDLARATQHAILAIMDAKPELYHWAQFVLNGYWMYGVRGQA